MLESVCENGVCLCFILQRGVTLEPHAYPLSCKWDNAAFSPLYGSSCIITLLPPLLVAIHHYIILRPVRWNMFVLFVVYVAFKLVD